MEYTSSKLATTVAENMNNFNLAGNFLSIEVISNEEATKMLIASSLANTNNNVDTKNNYNGNKYCYHYSELIIILLIVVVMVNVVTVIIIIMIIGLFIIIGFVL